MADKPADTQVGPNLKRLRGQAGLSLSKTADLTGVSKAMLGQIERSESSPTLATLWKLCNGLHLPLTALIGPPATLSVNIPQEQTTANAVKDAPSFRTLFPFDPQTGCEVFVHDLAPHWEHLSQAHSEGVMEDIFVISGRIEILVGGDWVPVETNQALRFKADQPHGYRNPMGTVSRFHNTIHYPGISQMPPQS
jgi:transcriptional regulator with XRE-family HTH domain